MRFVRHGSTLRGLEELALRDGVASRELDEALDPDLAAVALAGAVMYRRMMTPSPLLPSEVEALVTTVLSGRPR